MEENIKILEEIDITDFYNTYSEYTFPDKEVKEKCVALKTVLSELEKKDKVINEMAEQLVGLPIYDEKEVMVFFMNNEEVKEYFTNKVEREGK